MTRTPTPVKCEVRLQGELEAEAGRHNITVRRTALHWLECEAVNLESVDYVSIINLQICGFSDSVSVYHDCEAEAALSTVSPCCDGILIRHATSGGGGRVTGTLGDTRPGL